MKRLIEISKSFFGTFISVFCDQFGEGENPNVEDEDQDGAVGETGDDDTGSLGDGSAEDGTGEGGEEGSGEEDETGGDDDDKNQFAGYSSVEELVKAHETMKGQTSATEGNLRKMRSALRKQGIMYDHETGVLAVIAQDGTPQTTKQKRQSKFTDEHRNKFNRFFSDDSGDESVITATRDEFLNLMNVLVEDRIEEIIESRQEQATQRFRERRTFTQQYNEATQELFRSYPQLKQGNEGFDKEFHDEVMAYLNENQHLQFKSGKHADGELIAADRVARQRNISPIQIGNARKVGYKKGSEKKTIVSSGGKKPSQNTGFKRLSEQEYLALSSDEKREYNEKLLNIS